MNPGGLWRPDGPTLRVEPRIAHHIGFRDYADAELPDIAERMLAAQNYRLDADARAAMAHRTIARRTQPHFANTRSIRNTLDRARLRQADRLSLMTGPDIRISRMFRGRAGCRQA